MPEHILIWGNAPKDYTSADTLIGLGGPCPVQRAMPVAAAIALLGHSPPAEATCFDKRHRKYNLQITKEPYALLQTYRLEKGGKILLWGWQITRKEKIPAQTGSFVATDCTDRRNILTGTRCVFFCISGGTKDLPEKDHL